MDLLKIKLLVDLPIVKETLNRIGIINKIEKIIYPSCYVLLINEEYHLLHFKQIFLLKHENSYNNISSLDIERRNAIAFCLKNWRLIDVDDDNINPHHTKIEVIPFNEKMDWHVNHKIDLNVLK